MLSWILKGDGFMNIKIQASLVALLWIGVALARDPQFENAPYMDSRLSAEARAEDLRPRIRAGRSAKGPSLVSDHLERRATRSCSCRMEMAGIPEVLT